MACWGESASGAKHWRDRSENEAGSLGRRAESFCKLDDSRHSPLELLPYSRRSSGDTNMSTLRILSGLAAGLLLGVSTAVAEVRPPTLAHPRGVDVGEQLLSALACADCHSASANAVLNESVA